MNIEIGKHYVNKTWRFLVPCLKDHGAVFTKKFNSLFKLVAGIHDILLDGSPIAEGRNIFVLFDAYHRNKEFKDFLLYIRAQPYYKGDYCPEPNILSSRKHMVIIEVPEEYFNAYDKFMQGNYSEMYTQKQINDLFLSYVDSLSADRIRDCQILLKSGNKGLEYFKNEVYKEYGTITDSFTKTEWELPLKTKEEIFHYPDNDKIFINGNKEVPTGEEKY